MVANLADESCPLRRRRYSCLLISVKSEEGSSFRPYKSIEGREAYLSRC